MAYIIAYALGRKSTRALLVRLFKSLASAPCSLFQNETSPPGVGRARWSRSRGRGGPVCETSLRDTKKRTL